MLARATVVVDVVIIDSQTVDMAKGSVLKKKFLKRLGEMLLLPSVFLRGSP